MIDIYNAIKQKADLYTPEVQKLKKLQPIPVEEGILSAAVKEDAIGNAVRKFRKKYPNGVVVNTIIGDVFIDGKSIKNSLSRFLYPSKFDAVLSIPEGMKNAAYMGNVPTINDGTPNHFFVYPIFYKNKKSMFYVELCHGRKNLICIFMMCFQMKILTIKLKRLTLYRP